MSAVPNPAPAPYRFSHLRAYGKSPLHGHHARTTLDEGETRSMERGSAVHAITFGTQAVIGYPGSVRRGKEWDVFAALHSAYLILTSTEYAKAKRMADAIRQCKLAEPWLNGVTEQTIMFRWMGLDCRSTPDVRGSGFLTELKTSNSSEPMKFSWQAKRMHYHAQMRMQQIATKDTDQPCMIVCVEDAEPHPVTVFQIEPPLLEQGEKLLVLWAERLKNCEASGFFPPYSQSVVPILADDELELEYAD